METQTKEVTLVGVFASFNVNEEDKATADLQLENGKTMNVYIDTRDKNTNLSLFYAWFMIKNKLKVVVKGLQREDLPDTIFNGVIIEKTSYQKK